MQRRRDSSKQDEKQVWSICGNLSRTGLFTDDNDDDDDDDYDDDDDDDDYDDDDY